MRYLLETDGIRALEAFSMANTLVAFDFDGTLAPIVDNPCEARVNSRAEALLRSIRRMAPIAIISGRALNDVRALLPTEVDYVIGNHGLEGLPSGAVNLKHASEATQSWLQVLKTELKIDGVRIEDKSYSIAVHYRNALNKRQVKGEVLRICATLDPAPRIVMGKLVVNLVSAGAPHKGVALLELMLKLGCRSAIYFGDDDNDEDVFRLGDESLLTVRIGYEESSAAMFYLKEQSEIDDALSIIDKIMHQCGKSRPEADSIDRSGHGSRDN